MPFTMNGRTTPHLQPLTLIKISIDAYRNEACTTAAMVEKTAIMISCGSMWMLWRKNAMIY